MGRPLPRKMLGPIADGAAVPANIPTPPSKDGEDQRGNNLTGSTVLNRQGFNVPVESARVAGGAVDNNQEGNASTPFILRQRSAARFLVKTIVNSTELDGVCKLVSGESALNEGEMVLKGFVDDAGDGVTIRKISGRKAFDFDSNAYVWHVAGDGSSLANRIILTAI